MLNLDARNIESLPRYSCYANHKKCTSFRPNIHTEVKQNLMQILGQNLDQVLQKPDITTNVVSKVLTHYVAAVI